MEDRKTVLIRADGNPDIATGHLMRCLSIAEALREQGAQAEFAVADPVSAGLLASFWEEKEEIERICDEKLKNYYRRF